MAIRIDGTNTTANPGITGADADTGLQFGTNELKLVTGGTEAVKIDSNQKLTASQGILFGTDTATANTLDDYEEGTYTPTFVNGTWVYTAQDGNYVKIGNLVTVWCRISWSTKPTGQTLRITLPFTSINDDNEFAGTISGNGDYNYSASEKDIACYVLENSNELVIALLRDGLNRLAGSSNDLIGDTMVASITYQTA